MSVPVPDDLLRVRRLPERGSRDPATIRAVVDAGLVCHLGYVQHGRPVVVPTLHARDGDDLVLHGSAASSALRAATAGLPVCATITLLDGLVLARSAFHHSVNYRSVVVHGEAIEVTDPDAKLGALRALTEHVAPGRWAQVRPPTPQELRATRVLRLPLDRAVAKVRAGGVGDDEADLALPVWAGVVPLATAVGAPEPADGVDDRLRPPDVVSAAAAAPPTPGSGVPATLLPAASSSEVPV